MTEFEKSEQIPQWIKDIMSGPMFVAPEGVSLEEYYHAKGLPTGYSTPPPVTPEQFAPGSEIPYWVYSKENQKKIEEFQKKQAEQAFPITVSAAGSATTEEPTVNIETIEGVHAEPQGLEEEAGPALALGIGILALALAGGI